jgi:hypothetical protein
VGATTPTSAVAAHRAASNWLPRAEWALLVTGLALVQVLPTRIDGDGLVRYRSMQALIDGRGVHGAFYAMWGVGGSIPLQLLGRAVGHPAAVTAHYNGILAAATVLGLALALRPVVDPRTLRAFLLLLVSASMLAAHAEQFYGEVFTLLLVGVGLALVVTRPAQWAWGLVVLGVANTPAVLPALVLVVVQQCWRQRQLRHLWAIAGSAGLIVLDNAWRGVSLIHGAYPKRGGAKTILPYSHLGGFSYPFVLGVAVIIFSFGKGLIFFAPGLALSSTTAVRSRLSRAGRQVLSTWVLFIVGMILVYARWWAWYGGVFWGPRFFLLAILPASLALAALVVRPPARAWASALVLGVLLLSAWVAVDGAAFQTQQAFQTCVANHYALESLCWYAPEFSPLWRPFLDPLHVSTTQLLFVAWVTIVALLYAVPLAVHTVRAAQRPTTARRGRESERSARRWTW